MAEKPYRVYRGGRTKGKVPGVPRPERRSRDERQAERRGTLAPTRRRRPGRWRRRLGLLLLLILVAAAAWAITSYLAFRKGVEAANARLDPEVRAALAPQDGLVLSNATTVLLLGTDHSDHEARQGSRRSDSIMLVRTDPARHRLAYLSIPRDLRVDVPGLGQSKINAAFQSGGPALAAQTVRNLTGIPVNHVVIVDFGAFEQLIDTLGGITVDVPEPIVSNRFDCPYATAQCASWSGWRFAAGPQHMDGRRALIYSRVRENTLNPAENDITRGERQQAVLQALTDELTSVTTLAQVPFNGDELLRPLTTDLTTGQFIQLAWLKYRYPADRSLHCRLGGSPSDIGGESFLIGTEENVAVVHMVIGASAPQPPLPGSGPFGPGCVVGRTRLAR